MSILTLHSNSQFKSTLTLFPLLSLSNSFYSFSFTLFACSIPLPLRSDILIWTTRFFEDCVSVTHSFTHFLSLSTPSLADSLVRTETQLCSTGSPSVGTVAGVAVIFPGGRSLTLWGPCQHTQIWNHRGE